MAFYIYVLGPSVIVRFAKFVIPFFDFVRNDAVIINFIRLLSEHMFVLCIENPYARYFFVVAKKLQLTG